METVKRIISNFTLGITLLILAYVLIYYLGNDSAYNQNISTLQNINCLISQCIVAGILNVVMNEVLECANKYSKKHEIEKLKFKEKLRFLVEIIILFIIFAVVIKNISMPSLVQSLYIFNIIMAMIIKFIVTTIQKVLEVEVINKYLKKREKEVEK